ncbi:MAG: diheme cytochrome c-553 [Thermodesulfobacteriota bacterium]
MGEALVMEGRCGFCHTPLVETIKGEISDNPKYLSGHPSDYKLPEIPKVPFGSQQWLEFISNLDSTVWVNEDSIIFSANITPDEKSGIGTWTEKMFINTIRTGKHPGWKRDLKKPMPWLEYSRLSNEQLTAIFSYLISVKPVYNKVPEQITLK